VFFFFFTQKTAYEMVGSDWSSDVCSSDLGGVPCARHQRRVAVRAHRVRDAGVVRGDVHRGGAALGGALAYPYDHRPAAEVGEGFSREAGRRVARGNDDAELHATSSSGGSLRASSSSITGMPSFTGYARRSGLQT